MTTTQEQIRDCVWLNMHGKVQNQRISPWETQRIDRFPFFKIRKTGTPLNLKLMLRIYSWWGESEQLVCALSELDFSILQEH